ncbi:hypothetical protein L6164_002708 [Bauhinia variegata]|uniref:Uncharacterized protein n=1 Tax=Bauhinia variegata TaxID=167791 RepID=A0ACB9Q4J3_BAUVA|nr:hypothetical protein L6164_002708 [Bauhinia variegata]
MECHRNGHQEVLPIFYNVGRHQRVSFGEAFQQLVKRTSTSEYKITNWRRCVPFSHLVLDVTTESISPVPWNDVFFSFLGLECNNSCGESAILNDQPNLRSLWVQYRSWNLTQDVTRILDGLSALEGLSAKSRGEIETTTNASQITHVRRSLNSLLIQMGVSNEVTDTLRRCILQIPSFLPGDNYPHWLAYTDGGSSISFEVPKVIGCKLKGMTLYILYSCNCTDIVAPECVPHILLVHQTRGIIQIHKRDALTTFADEEWKRIISNLKSCDKVRIIAVLGNRFIVKNTTINLLHG